MRKLKKLSVKYYAAITVVCLVLVIAVAVGVNAFSSFTSPQTVIENVETFINQAQIPITDIAEEIRDETLSGSPEINNNPFVLNGEQHYTYTPTFTNATTTFVKVETPFKYRYNATTTDFKWATSTVESVRLDITGVATSSLNFICGTDADGYNVPDGDILMESWYATSSLATLENNIASSSAGGFGGGSTAKVLLTESYPFFICAAQAPYEAGQLGALTEVTNTFAGKATVRITK